MSVVVVPGGIGDLGRVITDALFESGKHEVYILSRKVRQDVAPPRNISLTLRAQIPDGEANSPRISPLTGKSYLPVLQTDYSSEDSLVSLLTKTHATVIICAFIMDNDSVCDAERLLIRAAERCPSVRRFIPSEFNVEYDVGDDVLPYAEKRFHIIARQELARTSTLEYAYVYPGMFMDYFGLPRVKSYLRPLCFFVDPEKGQAVLPDDGESRMSMTFTADMARYLVLALDLDKWPRILSTVVSTVTLNELVDLIERSMGRKLEVRYQSVEKLLKHEAIDLQTNVEIARDYPERFPEGLAQLRGLMADLEAGVALGAYDLDTLSGHLDLVKEFEGKAPSPIDIERLIHKAWSKHVAPQAET